MIGLVFIQVESRKNIYTRHATKEEIQVMLGTMCEDIKMSKLLKNCNSVVVFVVLVEFTKLFQENIIME